MQSEHQFSDYIVYVDESGDHGMQSIDPSYPVFALALCVFHKQHYSEQVVPALHQFKFAHFGHDLVVLHEHEIRKERGDFKFQSRAHKHDFLAELTQIIEASDFAVISCAIDKVGLQAKQDVPSNPYHLALRVCLEDLYAFVRAQNQADKLTHVVVECRGNKEDNDLELEFRRICDGENHWRCSLPFDVRFASKKVNSVGLQLADLVARPIGLNSLRPLQSNRAYDILKTKLYKSEKPR
jgi:Protein of unknown function (DUF3800)